MPVLLLPPITTSLGSHFGEPLTEAPRYIRTSTMSRWHRPRSGARQHDGRETYTSWCNYSIGGIHRAGTFLSAEDITDGLPICATCDGRAVGAGQETDGPTGRTLLFTPQGLTPPTTCPASRSPTLYAEMPGGRVGRCLACGDLLPLRAMGGPHNPRYALVKHPTGPALVTPCPFHAWRHLAARDGHVVCACGSRRPHQTTPRPEGNPP